MPLPANLGVVVADATAELHQENLQEYGLTLRDKKMISSLIKQEI